MKVLVNAIPLANPRTGIGRYISCLYKAMGELAGPDLEIKYFDGSEASSDMPHPPARLGRWSVLSRLFWGLPPRLALAVRLAAHARRERAFTVAAQGFDLYHETAFFPFPTPPDVRTVFTVHDLSLDRYPQWHPAERVLFHRRCFAPSLAGVDRFLTVSRFTRDELTALYPMAPDRATVTPLAVDPTLFRPWPRAAVEAGRLRCGLPERYLLFVGGGDPRKNAGTVLAAMDTLPTDIRLAVVGWEGWDRTAAGRARTMALGYVPDEELAALYAGALALVYPSLYEGFGLPILEAMACGCPVVCSRLASLPEVGGEAALYLEDPTDPAELAGVLNRLVESPLLRADLSVRGLAQASRFSWESTAAATLRIFTEVMSA
jgi:alpha-1,3-rhamnosyl/mannosyltransferase